MSGWTCQTCKAYVPMGQTHFCPGTAVAPAAPVPAPLIDQQARIAGALERIASALETLARRNR